MSRVVVTVRCRPCDDSALVMRVTRKAPYVQISVGESEDSPSFRFDEVLDGSATQATVFERCAAGVLDEALGGLNGCVFTFGQTGSGKTHTLFGAAGGEERGLCLRAAEHLFAGARRCEDDISIRLSVLEIYNETLIDLLRESSASTSLPKTKLTLVDTPTGVIVPSLFIMPLSSEGDANNLLFDAFNNRVVAEHLLNRRSSRSHIMYTFYITRVRQRGDDTDDDQSTLEAQSIVKSKVHFIDLAGSEKTGKTKSESLVLTQANYINKSLSFLEQVVIALTQPSRTHIPYRQSKLTFALKDCLGGICLTHMIACVWPLEQHTAETLATLRFANRMSSIENDPVKNRVHSSNESQLVLSLRKQISDLKNELKSQRGESRIWKCGTPVELCQEDKVKTLSYIRQALLCESLEAEEVLLGSRNHAKQFITVARLVLESACTLDRELAQVHTDRVIDRLTETIKMKPGISRRESKDVTAESPKIGREGTLDVFSRNLDIADAPDVIISDVADENGLSFDAFKMTPVGEALSSQYEAVKSAIGRCKYVHKQQLTQINENKEVLGNLASALQANVEREFAMRSAGEGETSRELQQTIEHQKNQIEIIKAEQRALLIQVKNKKVELADLQIDKRNALTSLVSSYKDETDRLYNVNENNRIQATDTVFSALK